MHEKQTYHIEWLRPFEDQKITQANGEDIPSRSEVRDHTVTFTSPKSRGTIVSVYHDTRLLRQLSQTRGDGGIGAKRRNTFGSTWPWCWAA